MHLFFVIFKSLVVSAFAIVFVLLLITAKLGRKIRRSRAVSPMSVNSLSPVLHKKYATYTVIMTVVAIVLTEILVRMKGEGHFSTLFAVHLFFFATPFLFSLLILRFKIDGYRNSVRYPKLHRNIAYICVLLFIGTFSTGAVLMYKL